jgi:hypothetical protein
LTAIEDGCSELKDEELLERVRELKRAIFTHDVGFKTMAQNWQREGRQFAGLIFGSQLGATIGQLSILCVFASSRETKLTPSMPDTPHTTLHSANAGSCRVR